MVIKLKIDKSNLIKIYFNNMTDFTSFNIKMGLNLYFDHLPDELIRETLFYLTDYDSFNNIYHIDYYPINKILDDHYFWKYLIELNIGYLSKYITPLENRTINMTNVGNFLYRLIYYLRAMGAYSKSMEIYQDNRYKLSKLYEIYFPSGEIPKDENVSHNLVFFNFSQEIPKISLGGKFLTDYSLFFQGLLSKSNDILYKFLSNGNNITYITMRTTISNYYVGFGDSTLIEKTIINKEDFLALLFHVHFNGGQIEK